MMKKRILQGITVLVCALLPLILIVVFALQQSAQTAQEQAQTQEEFSFATVSFALTETAQTLHPWHDEVENIYYVFLPSFATGEIRLVQPKGETLVLQKGRSRMPDAFVPELETPYQLHRSGTASTVQRTATLIFTQSANVSTLFVETETGSLDTIHADKANKESGTMCMVNADGTIQHKGKLDYIKTRGNQTYRDEKQSYNIQLAQAADLMGTGLYDEWALIANVCDLSNLRNAIVYDLAASVDLAYTSSFVFVDVYANGVYEGLYLMVEPVNNGRIDIQNLNETTKAVNNQKLDTYPQVTTETETWSAKGYATDRNPIDITGGYLMELEIPERYNDANAGFVTSHQQRITFKLPQNPSIEQAEYCAELVQEFEDAMYAPDGINPTTGKSIEEYIDLDSWVKKYLLEEIVQNMDAGLTSNFFYKNSDSIDGLLYAGPAWDYDWSLGNGEYQVRSANGLYAAHEARGNYWAPWFAKLYKQPEFYNAVVQAYQETFVPQLQEMLDWKIDAYVEQIRASYAMNELRMKNEAKRAESVQSETIDESAAYIKSFLAERMQFLDSLWVEETEHLVVTVKAYPAIQREMYLYLTSGETLESIQELLTNYPGFVALVDAETKQTVSFDTAVMQDMTIEAVWQ